MTKVMVMVDIITMEKEMMLKAVLFLSLSSLISIEVLIIIVISIITPSGSVPETSGATFEFFHMLHYYFIIIVVK